MVQRSGIDTIKYHTWPRILMGKWQTHRRHHKREPRGQPFPSRWPQSTYKQTRTKHSKHKTEQKHKRSTKKVQPWISNSGDTQIYMCIHVPFGHAVFIKKHFGTSSVISDQASMYMYSLVSIFCSRLFSVKQLTFEIYIILCQYSYHSFIKGYKNKFCEINIWTAISSHQVMGMSLTKVWVWKIYHAEYGPFLAADWLKTKGSGRVMG